MPSLTSDIEGRVKRLPLKPSAASALMPLFEAVSNSLHAIQDRFGDEVGSKGRVEIEVLRLSDSDSVTGFVVTDNGSGFTDDNYQSFLKPDSLHKFDRGGKGVGRLGWLKVFRNIQVDSAYLSNGSLAHRAFDFVLANEEQVKPRDTKVTLSSSGTRLSLAEYDGLYGPKCPVRWKTIVDHLVGHFLPVFVTDAAPKVRYLDRDQDIDLKTYFREQVESPTDVDILVDLANGENITLRLRHMKAKKEIRSSQPGLHCLFLAAHDRVAEVISLDEQLGLKTLDGETVYLGCASGAYLNDHVNQERTRFTFESDDSSAIRRALARAAREYLDEYVQRIITEKERIAIDVIAENPQFLYLRSQVRDFVSTKLAPNDFKREDILVEMSRDRFRKQNTFKGIEKAIHEAPQLDQAVTAKIEELQQFIQDQQKGALAEYVLRRKAVLDLLDKFRGYEDAEAEKHFRENAVHKLICPMRLDSSQLDFKDHNLWIVDDRLAFFSFFASDKEVSAYTDNPANDRPDLAFFYDACFAWRGSEESPNTIVLVEFKRPGREDYQREGPLAQVIRYVNEFKSTKTLKDSTGKVLGANVRNANFQCYIVADRTKGLEESLMGLGRDTPDGEGLFGYTDRPQVYFEVIPYPKLIRDAKARNAIFFHKLGLNDHGR